MIARSLPVSLPWLACLGSLLLGCGLLTCPSAQADTAVTLICVDAATGKPTPASICLTDDQGRVRLPPDGRLLRRPSLTQEFYRGVEHDPGPHWIGPVRKMQGVGNNNDRSFVYEERPSIPWWPEPVSFLVNGKTHVQLPAGRWHLAAERGMEYVPVRETFATTGQGKVAVTLHLRRWIDLPAQGWWSGDVHVHHPTTHPTHRDFLLTFARGTDLHVVNVLEMGHHRGTDFPQAGFGESFRVREGDYWLVSGQEDPRSNFGHIIGLNLRSMVRDLSTYDFYDVTFDGIHRQPGALVGFAHFAWNGCALPRGFPWYVTTEDLDFVELMQFGLVNSTDYHDYLNLGLRLTAAAGSDIPWGSQLGEVRTFVHCPDPFTPDAWFKGIKEGRTFVSNGPALEFTIDGERPGATLERGLEDHVEIRVRARCHPSIGTLQSLMVMGTDGFLLETETFAEENTLELQVRHLTGKSRWFTARARCHNGAQAHSSPIYLVVDGQPTWSAQRGPEVVDEQLQSIALIEAEFEGKRDPRSLGILKRLRSAREWYQKRLSRIAP